MRGEYAKLAFIEMIAWELPPRARRIHIVSSTDAGYGGTTSACAENTFRLLRGPSGYWNYLRVRGEYLSRKPSSRIAWELPPRARRIRDGVYAGLKEGGTTSACAENTLNELGLL